MARGDQQDARDRARITLVRDALAAASKTNKLLEAIAWPARTEKEFFAGKAERLPQVRYEFDRDAAGERISALDSIAKQLDGDDPVTVWLRSTVESLVDGNRLLLAAGTTEFYRISRELYGGARTRFPGDAARNIDLAEHLLARLDPRGGDAPRAAESGARRTLEAGDLAQQWSKQAERHWPGMTLTVELDDVAARVLAGTTRVRVRRDASFAPWEARGLWAHEVETHALTAQNGAAQSLAPFLKSGGPRTTRTQEGLAVFSEMYAGGLAASRIERLARRVKLVEMAEEGADFIALYRYLREAGSEPREAYLDAQRICRGGRVEGGAPFTKDACYLAGLLRVYAFLSVAVRGGLRDEVEMLVCGRVELDDVAALADLRRRGLLEGPKFVPPWLADWDRLLAYFAFASFFNGVNLEALEARYAGLLQLGDVPFEPSK